MQITSTLHKAARIYPNALATEFADRRQNFSSLIYRVSCLAAGFKSLGLKPGDRLAILSLNNDKLFEAILATLWAGGVAVPLNTRWTDREIANALDDSGAGLFLVSEHFSNIAGSKVTLDLVEKSKIICFNSTKNDRCEIEALIAKFRPVEDMCCQGDDLAFILYTGGTTGQPKGVMLSHGGLMSAAASQSAAGCGTQGKVYLHAAPMFHMADLQMMANHLLNMGTHAFLPAFEPGVMLQFIEQKGVSDILMVPTMIQALLTYTEFSSRELSSLKTIFYGAAPMTPTLLNRALKALPQCQFIQGYGMTETCLAAMLPASFHLAGASGNDARRMRSAGLELPLAELRIADSSGNEVPHGDVGEIQIRGPSVMKGYWRNTKTSASALAGGWMHTEDLAYRDSDGFIYIVDRLKDMIISGGENIYSSEVENVLSQHPAVAQCAVIGVADEKWGELVLAEVVLKKDEALTSDVLIAFCREFLSGFKCPRVINFTSALPVSPAGKILKSELRKRYQLAQSS